MKLRRPADYDTGADRIRAGFPFRPPVSDIRDAKYREQLTKKRKKGQFARRKCLSFRGEIGYNDLSAESGGDQRG
jgi:hypothetical protein